MSPYESKNATASLYMGGTAGIELPYSDLEESEATPASSRRISLTAWAVAPVLLLTTVFAHQFDKNWIPQVCSLCLVGLWLIVDLLSLRRGAYIAPPFIFWICWCAWELIGNLSTDVEISIIAYGLLSTIKVFALGFVISNIVRNYRQMIPVHIASALAPVVLLLLFRDDVARIASAFERGDQVETVVRFGHDGTASSEGQFGNPNALSFLGCYSLVSAVSLFLVWKRKPLRWLALAAVVPILAFINYTGSRTGMICVPAIAFCFWFFYLRDVSRGRPSAKMLSVVVMACVLGGAFAWLLTSPFFARFSDHRTSYGEDRGVLAKAGLKIFLQSPIVGHGMFGFARLGAQYGAPSKIGIAHNTYVETLVRGGVPGFLLYYSAWFVFVRQAWRLRRLRLAFEDRVTVNMVLLFSFVFLFFGLTGSEINPRVQWLTLGACIGYIYALTQSIIASQAEEAYAA